MALLLAPIATAMAAPAAATAADVSGSDIVGFLNTQRAAQGLPAGIVEDPALSDGCAKHNAYDRLNGGLTHGEDPSRPGYTPEGDQAGKTSVLYSAGGGPWTATSNPFETAPIHLHQLLAPRLDVMGAAETQGWGCATTLASRNRPAPPADVTYTYPGDGAADWSPAQTAAEGPYTPGERVGIPAGATTGPYLYVMFDGADLGLFDEASATSATVTGPSGPVDVAVVDNHTSGLQGYLSTGMELIPRAPLTPLTRYVASVTASVTTQNGNGAARDFTHTWSFTTAARPNSVQIGRVAATGRRVRVSVSSDAPGAIVTATGPGASASQPVGGNGTATLNLAADGRWELCARSGGGESGYVAAESCTAVTIRSGGGSSTPFSLSAPGQVRHGHRITVSIRSRSAFTLRLTLRSPTGRVLLRDPLRTLAGGTTWTYRLPVSRSYNRVGRSVRLELIIRAAGKRHVVRRTIRFR